MDIPAVVVSQYFAAFDMLKEAVEKCPDELWAAEEAANPFYQVAYHALFYAHLYVQPAEEDFTVWEKHIEGHESFGQPGYPGAPKPPGGEPYSKDDVLDYMDFCRNQIETIAPTLNYDAESGFSWLPFGKLELQFYSIRHVQSHAGELAERLSAKYSIEIDWVGTGKR